MSTAKWEWRGRGTKNILAVFQNNLKEKLFCSNFNPFYLMNDFVKPQ